MGTCPMTSPHRSLDACWVSTVQKSQATPPHITLREEKELYRLRQIRSRCRSGMERRAEHPRNGTSFVTWHAPSLQRHDPIAP